MEKAKKEARQALEFLAQIADEAGNYGEAKTKELEAVVTLSRFIRQAK